MTEHYRIVSKKQKNCDPADPADDHKGDWWKHVAYDPEHRLVLAAVKGRTDGDRGGFWRAAGRPNNRAGSAADPARPPVAGGADLCHGPQGAGKKDVSVQ
jgi:hypothetical protein